MTLKEIRPSLFLAEFISFYRIIDFKFPDKTKIPPKAYAPKPEHCLQFFSTPQNLGYDQNKKIVVARQSMLVGQHLVTNTRSFFDDLLSFQIIFQPGALYRLAGIPVSEFTNRVIEPAHVFGKGVDEFCERLFQARSYAEMLSVAETFLMKRLCSLKKDAHPMDELVKRMVTGYNCTLDSFIHDACLSHRQFDRKFLERTGIGAKEFMRVVRFYRAYLYKNQWPEKDWLTIALDCGYYDYQHLFKRLQGVYGLYAKTIFRT